MIEKIDEQLVKLKQGLMFLEFPESEAEVQIKDLGELITYNIINAQQKMDITSQDQPNNPSVKVSFKQMNQIAETVFKEYIMEITADLTVENRNHFIKLIS